MRRMAVTLRGMIIMATALGLLAACAQDDEILPGQRFGVDVPLSQTVEASEGDPAVTVAGVVESDRTLPITLPEPVDHAEWGHRNGSVRHRIRHPALDLPLEAAWSAAIGEGDTRRHRITASPVAGDGRIFTLDSRTTVTAFSLADGARLWSVALTPPGENPESASGGTLALAGGRLYVATGFGELTSLDPETGAEIWSRSFEAPMTGGVTVYEGLLYGVSRDSRAWALEADTGRVRWELPGVPAEALVKGGPAPVLTENLVIFPFGSGDLVGALRLNGIRIWQGGVSGRRMGLARASITDITGDPVIDGQTLYVGNQAGRSVALEVSSGNLIWSIEEGALGPAWPSGGSVFIISDRNALLRLDAADGSRIWETELPNFVAADKPQHRWKAVTAHHGPILAGGILWVASSDGLLRGFDPVSGEMTEEVPIRDGAASAPIVVGRTLYVVSKRGELLAFR